MGKERKREEKDFPKDTTDNSRTPATEAVWLLLLGLCSVVQDNIHDPPANPTPRGSVCAAAVLTLSVNC